MSAKIRVRGVAKTIPMGTLLDFWSVSPTGSLGSVIDLDTDLDKAPGVSMKRLNPLLSVRGMQEVRVMDGVLYTERGSLSGRRVTAFQDILRLNLKGQQRVTYDHAYNPTVKKVRKLLRELKRDIRRNPQKYTFEITTVEQLRKEMEESFRN